MEIGIAVLFVAIISLGATGGFVSTTHETSRYRAAAVSLDLRAPGNVAIVAAETNSITVSREVRDLWGRVTNSQRVENDTLTVASRCSPRWPVVLGDCRVDYRITVPAATSVSGTTRNGRLHVEGLEAGIEVATSNGDIRVADVSTTGEIRVETANGTVEISDTTGDLHIETSNGRIDVRNGSSSRIFARTSNAPIGLSLADLPERVEAETSNDDVDIALPAGDRAYAIAMTTTNGTSDLQGVREDPEAAYRIEAETQNGDISIRRRSQSRK